MNCFKFKKFGRTLLLLSAVASLVLTAVVWFGCGGGDNNPADNNSESGSKTHVHDWGAWSVTTQPTCAAQGVETRTCKLDATHKETQAVAKLTGAACETGGGKDTTGGNNTTPVCADWGDWVVTTPATCTMFGTKIRTCKSDATKKETQDIPMLASCSGNYCGKDGTANLCRTVTIGTLTWMAENLNYEPSSGNSWCYQVGYYGDKCGQYGRLYDWETAKKVCPTGWRLPTHDDWTALIDYAGGVEIAGTKLKSTSGWDKRLDGKNGNGTDDYGFSALPGGYRASDGSFSAAGEYGYWWTATEYDAGYMSRYDGMGSGHPTVKNTENGYSVRCVAGEAPHVHNWGAWSVTTPATCTEPGVATRTCKLDATHTETQEVAKLTGGNCDLCGGDGTANSCKTVEIGGQTWMAENMSYQPSSGRDWCYNCAKFGRLYDWSAALKLCPKGWHLPTREDWIVLVDYAGGEETAGAKLKSASGWGKNGTDEYGFSALPGRGRSDASAAIIGNDNGYWWTATGKDGRAYYRRMDALGDKVFEIDGSPNDGYSVRCIKDE